jgi:DNA-binding NtrC family response regulator
LHLALNRLDDCETALTHLASEAQRYRFDQFYAARWSTAVRAKLLIRRGFWNEAAAYAQQQAKRARAINDLPLMAALTSVHAEALASGGNSAAAGDTLLESSEVGAAGVREHAGHFIKACSNIVAEQNPSLAEALARRATRFWYQENNVCAQVESQSRGDALLEIKNMNSPDYHQACGHEFTAMLDPRSSAIFVTNAIGAALELSFDGELVRRELEGIAAATGCADCLAFTPLQDRRTRNTRGTLAGEYLAEFHGIDRGGFRVRCSPPADVLRAIPASDILRIVRSLETLAQHRQQDRNRAALWPESEHKTDDGIVLSEEMAGLRDTARRIAPTNVPVLITGETGTGKEVLARAIHAESTRASATFLPFNCSAGARDMIDAQLFGHRRGAFTGAVEHAPGVVRTAAGGTLFLDEIGEAPLDIQPKLLRFLESGEIHPVGEPQPSKVDVRVIAATNIDLDAAVSSGRFREDLFYRLNIVRLQLPPLRERRVEIPVFAQHYLRKHARELNKGDLRLAEETMEYLLLYRWPGNVRQLANEMRRLAALAEIDAVLMPEHLSPDIVASRRTVPASERMLDSNEVVVRLDQPVAAATEHLERAMLQYALTASGGRIEETARRLGLSRKGLYLKRLRFGLEPPEPHAARTA